MARILIVEPYDDVRELLALLVRRLGHEALTYRGAAGETHHVDLAIIEPADPIGYETAKSLRIHAVPLIFQSVYPPEPDTLAMQPAAYLVKPFTRLEFERALERALTD